MAILNVKKVMKAAATGVSDFLVDELAELSFAQREELQRVGRLYQNGNYSHHVQFEAAVQGNSFSPRRS